MSRLRHPSVPYLLVAGTVALAVIVLYFVQLGEAQRSAGRRIGVFVSEVADGVRIDEVNPEQPAAAAGLRAGDVVVEIDGVPVASFEDYDLVASHFSPEASPVFRVRRADQVLEVKITPGMPVAWRTLATRGVVLLCCLALGLLSLSQRPRAFRARLLWILLFLMAVEMALPLYSVGNALLTLVAWSVFYLVTGAQIAVELHLASSIPERQPWLDRWRWVVPLYYVLGLGLGVTAAVTVLVEAAGAGSVLPWTEAQISSAISGIGLPLWAGAVMVLLGVQARRFPKREGRMQAGLVLLGVVPWALYVYATAFFDLTGRPIPLWTEELFPGLVLCYPVAVFVAIYRYHLFDVELVVRHGLLYTALTTALLLIFYGALGAGGALFSQLVESERHSIWVISASTLILGVLFAPMRRWLEQRIDRALFPERQAMRQRLVRLASELPSRGTIHRMGEHLVERLCEIFGVRSATLWLAEPRSGLLLTVASVSQKGSRSNIEVVRSSRSLLLSPRDPGIELLRAADEPVSVRQITAESPGLRERLEPIEARLMVRLVHDERLVGALALGPPKTGRSFGAEQTELLSFLAHHVAISLENVQLSESATYEGLTGLRRREAILELLDRELKRAQRYGRPLTVGMADLDHFKRVNDDHGHLAGDATLQRVAEELAAGLRSTDAIGRYGGEEFLLIFPETPVEGAAVVAEKIRSHVAGLEIPLEPGVEVSVSVSVGLASLAEVADPESCDARALIAAADAALYRAKRAGRNRVEPAVA